MRTSLKAFSLLALLCVGIQAAERQWKLPTETAKFKSGPGVELVTANCLMCHSADYVSTQPPLTRAGWMAAVQKMRDKYGAPLATNQVDAVVDYLVKAYGKQETK